MNKQRDLVLRTMINCDSIHIQFALSLLLLGGPNTRSLIEKEKNKIKQNKIVYTNEKENLNGKNKKDKNNMWKTLCSWFFESDCI